MWDLLLDEEGNEIRSLEREKNPLQQVTNELNTRGGSYMTKSERKFHQEISDSAYFNKK